MCAACECDSAVAYVILKKLSLLMEIWQLSPQEALALEKDDGRSMWALNRWWDAFQSLTKLWAGPVTAFGPSVATQFNAGSQITDSDNRRVVFDWCKNHLEPMSWESLAHPVLICCKCRGYSKGFSLQRVVGNHPRVLRNPRRILKMARGFCFKSRGFCTVLPCDSDVTSK